VQAGGLQVRLRDAMEADVPTVLALNEASVHFLSAMDETRLRRLHAAAAIHQVAEVDGRVVGFLLAFREGADYDSVNYQWFDTRGGPFLYVDRVVVDEAARGRGVATALYRHVFEVAARAGVPWVTCEFDADPPNPISEQFHARFGFHEVGRQRVGYADKVVALQAAPVPAVPSPRKAWT
jgi:predicted GNAT superfamily acetyltransferase